MRRSLLIWCVLGALGLFSLGSAPAFAGGHTHQTHVTLTLSGSLVAAGHVYSGASGCRAHREVVIQKRGGGGGWQSVKSVESHADGSYRLTLQNEAGDYQALVKKSELSVGQNCATATSRVVHHSTTPPPPTNDCTPGYSPCLVWHGGADYDCSGGSGNGPYYTAPGVTYRVTGSDPYGLDADNDGYGCE